VNPTSRVLAHRRSSTRQAQNGINDIRIRRNITGVSLRTTPTPLRKPLYLGDSIAYFQWITNRLDEASVSLHRSIAYGIITFGYEVGQIR